MDNILQPSWTLFFSWGSFVFLSINFFVGILLSSTNIMSFILANIIAFVLLALTLYPTVLISVKYNLNYSESISRFIKNKMIQNIFIYLLIIVNIGWYSIQLTAVEKIFSTILYIESWIVLMFFSYLFSYGSYRFGYSWLKYFGIFTISLFLIYISTLFFSTDLESINIVKYQEEISFVSIVIMIYGTWAFSSSTVVMDIAKYTKDFKKSYAYILLGLLLGNFFLIALGYMFGKYTHIKSFDDFALLLGISFSLVLLLLNIWSTNDGNFFSSMKALESLNIKKQYAFIVLPFISAILAISFKDDLFIIIGSWLKFMGWISVPLTFFWWYIVIKNKKNIGRN